jgi:hypothetical protein
MASGRPVRKIVEAVVARDLSPEAKQRAIAGFARKQLAAAIEQNRQATGEIVPYEQFVDGRRGAALESVNPQNGRIVFRFDVESDRIFVEIADMLVRHAPRLTGRYADSFRFFAGGRELAVGEAPPRADEYVFVNVQPYARKIERGQSDQAPNGVFQAVAALAKLMFGDVAAIRFSYRSFQEFGIAPYVPSQSGAAARARNRGPRGRFAATPRALPMTAIAAAAAKERQTRTPAIVVTFPWR